MSQEQDPGAIPGTSTNHLKHIHRVCFEGVM